MTEFFTWQILATYGGAVLFVTLITQLFKGVVPAGAPTRFVSYLAALLVLIAAGVFTGAATTVADIALCFINALVVSLAANGAYDAATGKNKKD